MSEETIDQAGQATDQGEAQAEATERKPSTELTLVSDARRALVQARTLPDFRKVEAAAWVAADAARKVAKLMEAQGMASEIVKAANEAANDAAAVRIEAQAGAGRLIGQMREEGLLRTGAGRISPSDREKGVQSQADLFGGDQKAAEWAIQTYEKVANIPDNVRADYVDDTVEESGEITTAGLLRYARKLDQPDEETTESQVNDVLEARIKEVLLACQQIPAYNAKLIAGALLERKRKTPTLQAAKRLRMWTDEFLKYLGEK